MRNLKKFLALALAMMMVLSLAVTVNAAKPADFADKDSVSASYKEAVNVLSALGVVKGQGHEDGTKLAAPKEEITRAEAAVMVYRIYANDAEGKKMPLFAGYSEFEDVTADWYDGAASYLNDGGIIKGDGEGHFFPEWKVTGYEILAMALRMLGYGQNGEFQGSGWQARTFVYARQVGLLKNVSGALMSSPATRELVAEILFQALQADLVDYNLLQNYHARKTLIAESQKDDYANAIAADLVTLPRNTDLMYENYKIVGKSPLLTFDDYGRPMETWVKDITTGANADEATESAAGEGDAGKFVPNNSTAGDAIGKGDETDDEKPITVSMPAEVTYYNAVTECDVAKDLDIDTQNLDWKNIAEVLNGNSETVFNDTTGTEIGKTHTLASAGFTITSNTAVNHSDGQKFDSLHTSDKFIGATGRTTEIYDVSDYNVTVDKSAGGSANQVTYVIVYVDTFLGRVKEITEKITDPNGHVIRASQATVEVGDNSGVPMSFTADNVGSHEVGDLVLVQTPNGGATASAKNAIDSVAKSEKTPLTPEDVPNATANFPDDKTCTILPNKVAAPTRMTITGTWGVYSDKTGVQVGNDVYYASNTFLTARAAGGNKTVLADWYDIPVPAKGITNSMIGKTYDVVFDNHGWIIGMDEVMTVESNVGVITGYDYHREGFGKYVTEVEAYMTDGQTRVFKVVDMDTEFGSIATNSVNANNLKLFADQNAADNVWTQGNTYEKLGVGSLVMFKQCKVDGVDAWYFGDTSDQSASEYLDGYTTTTGGSVGSKINNGTAGASVNTGNAKALLNASSFDATDDADIAEQLDNSSIIFVAEPEYRYNTGSENEGNNSVKYKVYTDGFKTMPTITQKSTEANILYQQLINNPEYVLVYPQDTSKEYIIRNQSTINVDESYLLLRRGATFADHAEYVALKNGVETTLSVSNMNSNLNNDIETAMRMGNLLVVTGRNSAGYVISADTLVNLASDAAVGPNYDPNCAGVNDGSNDNPLVAGSASTDFSVNDGVINFVDADSNNHALTLADNCTVQLINLGTGAATSTSLGVAKAYINKDGSKLTIYSPFTFEVDQYGYVCSLYVFEAALATT